MFGHSCGSISGPKRVWIPKKCSVVVVEEDATVDEVIQDQPLSEEVICDALTDEMQVAPVVDSVQEVTHSFPNQVGSPPLSFTQVVRGSPTAGSPVTAEQLAKSNESSSSKDGSSKIQSPRGGKESGKSTASKDVPTPKDDKGKKIWVDDPQETFQVVKKGGKGGKGKKQKK
ncbi:unnamed protein product [Linum trigynum]|uniref:Uncharacterized protein n=1 Tax=Linum trigynum TaxID=586398 RepID=A0AAV2GDJ1_9ROSI